MARSQFLDHRLSAAACSVKHALPRPTIWLMADESRLGLSQDAAIVLALAETAIPFAPSPEDEAERWVRLLRLHGQVGGALQALGVGEAPLETIAQPASARRPGAVAARREVVTRVAETAARFAQGRGAQAVATVDLLFAIFQIYGGTFDRALYIRGTSREELIERLASDAELLGRRAGERVAVDD
jgi:hypothetical protein